MKKLLALILFAAAAVAPNAQAFFGGCCEDNRCERVCKYECPSCPTDKCSCPANDCR